MTTDPRLAERHATAYELKRDGRPYRFIAETLGCSISTAWEYVQAAIKARMPAAAEEERQLEVDRFDRWLEVLTERLEVGVEPEKIVPVLLKVSERRARLMGLDAPTKFTGTLRPEVPSVGFARVIADAEAQAAENEDLIRTGQDEHGVA